MCCPVLRLDESVVTVLALSVESGDRVWSVGLARPNSGVEECLNLYSDSSVIAQIGKGRTDGSNNIHVRFHDASSGQSLALVDLAQVVNIADVKPVKTDNYYWLYGGLATATRKWFIVDAANYTLYGTGNVAYSVGQIAANPVAGQDKVFAVDTTSNLLRYMDKDGTATTSTIAGVTTITNATMLDSGNAAIRYNAGNLIGLISGGALLLSTSSVAGQQLRAAHGAYVAAADLEDDEGTFSEIPIEVWDTSTLATGPVWTYTDTGSSLTNGVYAKPSSDGNSVYVIASNERTIHKVNSTGIAWSVAIAVAPYTLTRHTEYDTDGNLLLVYKGASVSKFDPSIPGFVNVTESFATLRSATDGSEIWTTKFYKSEAAYTNGGLANGFRVEGDLMYVYGSEYAN